MSTVGSETTLSACSLNKDSTIHILGSLIPVMTQGCLLSHNPGIVFQKEMPDTSQFVVVTQDETHAGSNGETMTNSLFFPLACLIGKEFPGHISCVEESVFCSVLGMAQPETAP